nr:hypothetical protein [Tanacetum cinerariifolium]
LVDEDEDPKEDEFKKEEDPQEEDDDMKIDIEEDENEPEFTYPYEEVDPLNPSPPASESEPDDEIEAENPIEHEDETVPASAHEVGKLSSAFFLREDSDSLLHGLVRRDINFLFGWMASISRQLCGYETAHALVEKNGKAKDKFYGKLILELGNEVCSSMEQGTTTMEKLVKKLGNTEDKVECKKLKKELEEARFSNTFLRMQNERVEKDLYWTRVRAHKFYQEMIRRGFVFKESPNEAINVPIEDEKSHMSELRESPRDPYVDAAIATEQERKANVRNDASGSRLARSHDAAPIVHECTFAGFIKCNPAVFRGVEGAVELRIWFEKTKSVFEINECAEGKKVKFAAATLERPALTWWKIKVKEYNVLAYTQRFNELALMYPRMVEPERVKVDAYIWGLMDNIKGKVTSSKPVDLNEAVCMAHKLMEQKSQTRDARILEGKIRKWESLQSGNSSGHTRNRCPKKVKQKEVGEARGRDYAIKDAEPQGLNVVTGTFLFNNRY